MDKYIIDYSEDLYKRGALSPMNEKIIIIGLDGAPWTLLKEWISENKLPTFKKISREGFFGKLKSTIPATTIPAVPALVTGMNQGNLGLFSFIKADNSPMTLWDIKYQNIWSILSEQGHSSCIMNIPLTYPPQKLNGVMVSGWSPSDSAINTYPDYIQKEIIGFYDDEIQKQIFILRNKKNNKKHRKELLSMLINLIDIRYTLFKKIYNKMEFSFAFLWIYQTDFLQHCCWEFKELLLELYLKIDDILKDILLNYPDRNTIVLSDHGFESRPSRYFSVNSWLYKNNYLEKKSGLINHSAIIAQHIAYNYLPKKYVTKIIKFWQYKQRNSTKTFFIEKVDNFPGVDQQNSQAYLSTLFGININNNEKYESLREEIIKKLKNLKDEDNEYVIREICKKEAVYKGKYLCEIPDIIFLTSEKYVPFPALSKNIFGSINRKGYWWQTGEHSRNREGIILGLGPNIKNNVKLIDANIEDVFPTILYMLNCSIPSYCDGKLLKEITTKNIEPDYILKDENKDQSLYEHKDLSKMDEAILLKRLKNLGYLE